MNKPPSRSEIESALSTSHRYPSRGNNKSNDQPKETSQQRTRTIIGGTLTGVSKLKYTRNRSYIQWIVACISLLITAVFFWPQPKHVTNEISALHQELKKNELYSNSRIDQTFDEKQKQKQENFTRRTDKQRAQEFRLAEQQEKKISQLLQAADISIQKEYYLTPKSLSAYEKYQEILAIEPNNRSAKQGIEHIRGIYFKNGSQAIADNNPSKAQYHLTKLSLISMHSEEYLELNSLIDTAVRQKKVTELLAEATQAQSTGEYILPAKNNALYFYQQILELEPENTSAQNGVEQVVTHFITLANEAINDNNTNLAVGYLRTVGVIDPEHPSLLLLSGMTTTDKALSNSDNKNETSDSISAIRSDKTPPRESSEQELFDRQYLDNGLNAYYRNDYDVAKSLLQPLADKGISRAQVRIAYMHYLGLGFKKDKKAAERVINTALTAVKDFAKEGRTWAQSDLGSLYENGLVLKKDYTEAIRWYLRAAELGYPTAQSNLGAMYMRGRGVPVSRKTAVEWFQRAAKQGDEEAKRNLESMGVQF